MPRIPVLFAAILLASAVCPSPAAAQGVPQQQPRMPTPQQIGATVQQSLPVEGILGYLAFVQGVNDERLLSVRTTLDRTFKERTALIEGIKAGNTDLSGLRAKVSSIQDVMLEGLATSLTAEQNSELKQALGIEPAPTPPQPSAP